MTDEQDYGPGKKCLGKGGAMCPEFARCDEIGRATARGSCPRTPAEVFAQRAKVREGLDQYHGMMKEEMKLFTLQGWYDAFKRLGLPKPVLRVHNDTYIIEVYTPVLVLVEDLMERVHVGCYVEVHVGWWGWKWRSWWDRLRGKP